MKRMTEANRTVLAGSQNHLPRRRRISLEKSPPQVGCRQGQKRRNNIFGNGSDELFRSLYSVFFPAALAFAHLALAAAAILPRAAALSFRFPVFAAFSDFTFAHRAF